MSFAKTKISASFFETLGAIFLSKYIWFCKVTTRWTFRGVTEIQDALQQGPVILVLWHSRTVMGPPHWPDRNAKATTLFVTNRDGRIAAGIQARFGFYPFGMSPDVSNFSASRQVLKRMHNGLSLILTADGPKGPARILQDAPLEWIKSTNCPVFVYSNSLRRQKRLPGWDKLLFPFPFNKGSCVFHKWSDDIPRRPTDKEWAAGRLSLSQALDHALQEADRLAGVSPGP
ncbi:MAG: DUF374 domain-containing protein [Paracoccaceae bacterium]